MVTQEKCEFLLTSVEYLGHRIGKDGIQALKSKTDAIVNAPVPRNVQELRSFLGLLNYYGKFIPNLATVLHPLNSLLRADMKWVWTKECGEAFNQAKLKLTSAEVLAHYDPMLPLSLWLAPIKIAILQPTHVGLYGGSGKNSYHFH